MQYRRRDSRRRNAIVRAARRHLLLASRDVKPKGTTMQIDWLESMAVRLRGVLAEHGVLVAQDAALDLIAALVASPDWVDATAHPDRVAVSRFDDAAVERIVRRVTARHEVPINPQMLDFSVRRMSLLYRSPSASEQTKRLIVASTDSAAGHLMQTRIADRIEVTDRGDTLVSGPVPAALGPQAFFEAREAAYDGSPLFAGELWPWNRSAVAIAYWRELLSLFDAYERVELWIDPGPDAQLHLIRLLDWLAAHPQVIEKLYVVHADDDLGGRRGDDIRTMRPPIDKVDGTHLRLAQRAWDAYRRPTPRAWFDLLDVDSRALPHLQRAILLLLGELPASDTALGTTERLLLEVVEPGGIAPSHFSMINAQRNPARLFGAFDEYRIVRHLASCATPAIVGLHDVTFGAASMMDVERRDRYMRSKLSLSAFGRALLDDREDFSRHNTIHRWWGGTLLTNANLWRWDASHRRLHAPT